MHLHKLSRFPPRCEKIDWHPIGVIPEEAGISYFQSLMKFLDLGLHHGEDKKAIFSQLPPFEKGGRRGDLNQTCKKVPSDAPILILG
jgi:hypothetical protein